MRVHVLGSGSRGNAVVLESGPQRILIDAGFGPRALAERMQASGIAPESVSALVITHEHTDHIGGAAAAATRWRWRVYGTEGTLTHLTARSMVETVTIRREATLDDLQLRFVRTPHDAREPVALVATSRSSGVRVGIAYDLGHVTPRFALHFADVDILLLESNHDEEMLRLGPYPRVVKDRVAGPRGHLSNDEAGVMARSCVHKGLRHVVLCHLSQTNNRPDVALRTVKGALHGSEFRGALHAACQDAPITVGVGRGGAPVQLALGI